MTKSKAYHKNIRISFSSVEEQTLNSYQHWSKLSPSKRIAEATLLIRQIYGLDQRKKQQPLRITFDT